MAGISDLIAAGAYDRAREIRPERPVAQNSTIRGSVFNKIFDIAGGNTSDSAKRRRAMQIADLISGPVGQFGASLVPGVGEGMTITDSLNAFKQGKMAEGAALGGLAAIGAVPVVGDMAGAAIRKIAGKSITDDVASDVVSAIIKDVDSGSMNTGYGLRVIPRGYEAKLGDELPPSSEWVDNIKTDNVLDGTSTIGIDFMFDPEEDDVRAVINNLLSAGYDGDQVVLVGGKRVGYGQDEGELLIDKAKVLQTFINNSRK